MLCRTDWDRKSAAVTHLRQAARHTVSARHQQAAQARMCGPAADVDSTAGEVVQLEVLRDVRHVWCRGPCRAPLRLWSGLMA